MKTRCLNSNSKCYYNYGGRGITICDRWLESYLNFKEDMYESYQKHVEEFGEHNTTLDRIDVNGNYCPENCRWATWKEQENNRRNNRYETIGGVTKLLAEHIHDSGLNASTVYYRLNHGKSVENAFYTPSSANYTHYYHDMPLKQYCIENNLHYPAICYRLRNGWDLEDAVNIPINEKYVSRKKC